jgi:WYL domain
VAKGLVWYLIALRDSDIRTYRVPRIADIQVTDRRFDRPGGFRLADHWNLVCQRLAGTLPTYVVMLRTTETGLQSSGGAAPGSSGPVTGPGRSTSPSTWRLPRKRGQPFSLSVAARL